ncbi:hypothetical protein ACQPYK_20435 [Streptosporangium sp. CA-135522]|uniref:hypothetical protein n=1 Tax=Streptosporangium sp. CA-135522 TaxID=3240072 RepID=UPI003D8DB3E1
MPYPTRAERLDRVRATLQGRPATERLAHQATPPPGAFLLVGVMLRGAARLEAGLELTELEQELVDMLRPLADDDEEVRAFGRTFTEENTAGTRQILSVTVADRPLTEGYTQDDLAKDIAALSEELRALPNVNFVNIDALAEGDPLDSEDFLQAMADYGYGVTVVGSSRSDTATPVSPPPIDLRLDLQRFECRRSTGDTVFGPQDEIYWAYASANEAARNKWNKTREYGDVQTGSVRVFDAGTTLFNGRVGNSLPIHIQCWEADDSPSSWHNKLVEDLKKIGDKLQQIAYRFKDNPAWYWEGSGSDIGDYLTVITALVQALIEWFRNDDDLVQNRTIVFSRPALAALANRPGATDHWGFNGIGRFDLHIRLTLPDEERLRLTTSSNAGAWSQGALLPTATARTGAALAVFDNKLYCAHTSGDFQQMWWCHYDGTNWSADTLFPGPLSNAAPALAAYDNKLYCVHRGSNDNEQLYWSTFDGTSWSADTPIGGHASPSAPALAVLGNNLYCVYRGQGNGHLHTVYYNGNGWYHGNAWGQKSADGPALAVFQNKLYCVFRGPDSDERLYWARRNTMGGGSWSSPAPLGTHNSAVSPSLTVFNDGTGAKLYVVHRGSYANRNTKLYWSSFNGTSWSTDTPFSPAVTSVERPAVAAYDGKLHVVHRGGGLL